MRIKFNLNKKDGFTIIELMAATAVFSVILLLVTFGLIQIGRTYYRGLTSSKTQNVSRNLMDTVSQDIQFSSGSIITTTPGVVCIGNHKYSFVLGKKIPTTVPHAIWVDDLNGAPCTPTPFGVNSRELLEQNMRLSNFAVIPLGANPLISKNKYALVVRVVYGDDDLLCSESVPGDCSSTSPTTHHADPDVTCKNNQEGTQFCSKSDLSTIVQRRMIK